jgi:copper oxidase (laccase) domain-containing protein
VRWHDSLPDGWLILDGTDGHATAERGVLLTVTVADCVPVYLTVPKKGAIALVHAGWRGTADGILEQCVELLKWRGFAKASDIVMHCGVGICGNCYEVGSEVAVRFGLTGTVMLDLRAILTQHARQLGIDEISVSPLVQCRGSRPLFLAPSVARAGWTDGGLHRSSARLT